MKYMSSFSAASVPFVVTFKSDGDELATGGANMATTNEGNGAPGGIVGFSINYVQQAC